MSETLPLVLLPGLLCDSALWQHQLTTLADMVPMLVPDLSEDDHLGAAAQRVLRAAPDRFSLAGLSMGGYIAFEVLRQAPDRVARLALVSTTAHPDRSERTKERRAAMALADRGEFKGVTRRLLPTLIHNARLNNEDLIDTITGMAERVGREAFLRQQRLIINRPDSRHDLGLIHCPTAVICGRHDQLTPLADSIEMADEIPGGRLVVIEDCGHLPPLEQPHAVSAVMRLWLQID